MPEKTQVRRRVRIFAGALLLIYIFYLLEPVNVYLWLSLKETFVSAAVTVTAAFYLYFRKLREGPEIKLLALLWLWYAVTLLLHGPNQLIYRFPQLLDMTLPILFLAVGFALDREERLRFLDWVAAVLGLFFFILGVIGIAAFILRISFINPITERVIAGVEKAASFSRLNVADTNPNASALWYFMCFFLMVFEFFKCRKRRWRVPICLAAAVYYVTLALTYSRNVKAAFSGCVAMLLVLLALERLRGSQKLKKAAVILCILAAAVPLTYLSFDLTTELMSRAAAQAMGETILDASGKRVKIDRLYADPRALSESVPDLAGRTVIFKSAFITLAREPDRLLRGSAEEDMMSVANQVIPKPHNHFHNAFLQVLVMMGLPGFLLAAAFSLRLIRCMIKLFFSEEEISFPIKLLTLPLTGFFFYSMLEVLLFTVVDIRSLFFFLLAGIVLAEGRETYPYEQKRPLWR